MKNKARQQKLYITKTLFSPLGNSCIKQFLYLREIYMRHREGGRLINGELTFGNGVLVGFPTPLVVKMH